MEKTTRMKKCLRMKSARMKKRILMKKVYEWKVFEFNEEQPSNDNSVE